MDLSIDGLLQKAKEREDLTKEEKVFLDSVVSIPSPEQKSKIIQIATRGMNTQVRMKGSSILYTKE